MMWRIGLLLALLPGLAQGHPGRASEAELGWSADGSQLEVSLGVMPEDLERALKGPLEAAETRPALLAYLRQHFRITDAGGHLMPMQLLGIEADYRRSWLYFTVEAPVEIPMKLEFTLLQDLYPDQVNRAVLLWLAGSPSKVFISGDPPKEIPPLRMEPTTAEAF